MNDQNIFVTRLSSFFDQIIAVLSFDKEEIEKAKKNDSHDLFLLGFFAIQIFIVGIIEIDLLKENIAKWGFITILYPLLWFFANWILLRIEDLFRHKESYTSDIIETARLFIYILIPYLAIYSVNYIVFLFTYNYNYYIFNILLLFVLNVIFLKFGFKDKEFVTCVINGMFSVGIPYSVYLFL